MTTFTYDQVTVVAVHDGDTATFDLDLGFRVHTVSPLRLDGINAPELNTAEGKQAADYLRTLLTPGLAVRLTTSRAQFDKYGRYLATVTLLDGTCVNTQMISAGHAKAWNGQGVKPV